MPPTSTWFRFSLVVAGAMVCTAAAACSAGSSSRRASTTTTVPPPSRPADIDALLAAERRMLLGTWVVTENFERVGPAGRQLASVIHRAQRPPDTLNQGPTSADGRRNGRLISCAAGPTGGLVCKDGGPAPAFIDEVNTEIDNLKSYLVAALPLYRVVAAPGAGPGQCWRLLLAAPRYPSPPYGTRAVFCFDPATGAPSYSQIVRPEATDTTTAVGIRATVTDADLSVASATAGPGR